MRKIISYPSSEGFTQGSIFEGLKVNKNDKSTYAIVITARCDIENEKARNILCLPIYTANEWLKDQGEKIIFRRAEAKLKNKLSIELASANSSVDILDIYPKESIIEALNNKNKNLDEFVKLLHMYKEKKCDYSLKFILDLKDSLISSLVNNTESSIYFIEGVSFDKELIPYVIDLSEPISIPISVAVNLNKGVNRKNIDEITSQYLILNESSLSFISVLKSPYIEHVLQKFSSYYSRIGTEDIRKENLDILKEKINAV